MRRAFLVIASAAFAAGAIFGTSACGASANVETPLGDAKVDENGVDVSAKPFSPEDLVTATVKEDVPKGFLPVYTTENSSDLINYNPEDGVSEKEAGPKAGKKVQVLCETADGDKGRYAVYVDGRYDVNAPGLTVKIDGKRVGYADKTDISFIAAEVAGMINCGTVKELVLAETQG
jgi:hypothetical protein